MAKMSTKSVVRGLVSLHDLCTISCVTTETPFQKFLAASRDAEIAEQIGVRPRTVQSWRLGERYPRPEQAREIIARLPVTMDDIYGAQP